MIRQSQETARSRTSGNTEGVQLTAGLDGAVGGAAAHVEERLIQLQTGHRSLPTLRGYIRDGRLFHDNAAALVGL